ncbi:MAG: electron transfer flavoprotein subunit alpha/FixB family protein [Deltaproteobacteria bacterium]|nr:electron transfer flavoprotein subunit alpha/FixB family protein [Deltaproteobacteria bacterium]
MDNGSREVWVFIEHHSGRPADVSLELLSKGRKLAEKLRGPLKGILIGHEVDAVAKEAFRFGADELLVVDHPDLRDYRTLPYSRILCELVEERQPRVILYGATFIGRDLAPRIASNSASGLTADCTDLQIGDATWKKQQHQDLLLQIRPAFGGNIVATIITPDAKVQMATVREGVMEMVPLDAPCDGKITKIHYEPTAADQLVRIVERHREEKRSNLKGASIVVAGGYGVGSKKTFDMLRELADVIGAEIAGSRAAVDAGFISREQQVGQTGLTVRPKLYIACGISGAIQHVAGMQEANRIIAINSDPNAPIFDVCHYGIVGDVASVISTFTETYKKKLK